LLGQAALIKEHVKGRQVQVVTNKTVAPLYLEKTLAAFADFQTDKVITRYSVNVLIVKPPWLHWAVAW